MSDGQNPLFAPVRPGGVDVRGQQPSLFPFDAFEFDDPNKASEPTLRMKAPWKFLAESTITTEQLEAAFVSATEIIIGYLGSDPENPVVGDRRLIIKAFVLSLQHYDSTDPSADVDGWVDDISLGGFDQYDTFTDYIISAGLTQERNDVSIIESGLGLPPSAQPDMGTSFANSIIPVRLGEGLKTLYPERGVRGTYFGEDYYDSYMPIELSNANTYYDGGELYGTYISGFPYTYVATLEWYPDSSTFNYNFINKTIDGQVKVNQADIYPEFYWFGSTGFQVDRDTGELLIRTEVVTQRYQGTLDQDVVTTNTGLFLTEGVNYFNASGIMTIRAIQNVSVYNLEMANHGVEVNLVNASGVASSASYTPAQMAKSVSIDTATNANAVWIQSESATDAIFGNLDNPNFNVLNGGIYSSDTLLIENSRWLSSLEYTYEGDINTGFSHADLVANGLVWERTYFEDYFSTPKYWLSAVDKDRDVSLIPSSSFGKTFIASGGSIPETFSDKYITVAGPSGPEGPIGEKGDQGDQGLSFTDGGTFSTEYLPDQIIDGGGF